MALTNMLILQIQTMRAKIVGELPEMRRDTMDLVKKAVSEGRRAYVLVNNRSEGNASPHDTPTCYQNAPDPLQDIGPVFQQGRFHL